MLFFFFFFFFQAEDGIRDDLVTGVQTCALPISFTLVLTLEGFLRWRLRKKTQAVIDGVSCNAEGLVLFSNILELLEKEPFRSLPAQKLCAPLKPGPIPASAVIRRLARIVYWVDARHSLLAHLAELPFLYKIGRAHV